jgi:thiol-disulfide isomerase/thioredoxin
MQKWIPIVGAVVVWSGGPQVAGAQETAAKLFYPPSDAGAEITAALKAAKADRRHVLLDFGADWCPDCRVLGTLFEDAVVAPVLRENFHVVRVDVGHRDRNAELVEKYGATSGDWIPAVVVLDGDGRRIASTDTTVRLTRRTTAAELAARLHEWAPKKRGRELASVTESGVRVTLALDRDSRGGWWLAAEFTPVVPDAHLYSKDLPAAGIDGLGRPTTFKVTAAAGWQATGPVVADRVTVLDTIESLGTSLPIYPAGTVTLRQPIVLVASKPPATGEALVGYMACTPQGCLRPVIGKRIAFAIPSIVDRRP